MITTTTNYNQEDFTFENAQPPISGAIVLPKDEIIYNIDLNTRIIEAPEFLSVTTDHYAETVYFKVDRYFDNMDLTRTVCVVQYINENAINEFGVPAGGFAYIVPFYDIEYFRAENKILIPWCINGPATAAAGPVTFSLRFYLMNNDKSGYLYNLNTQPATSKVLHGMHVITKENENFLWSNTEIDAIMQQLSKVIQDSILYWHEPK